MATLAIMNRPAKAFLDVARCEDVYTSSKLGKGKPLHPRRRKVRLRRQSQLHVRTATSDAAKWKAEAEAFRKADRIDVKPSHEYASSIINSVWSGEPSAIYGNVRNNGCIASLPSDCAVEVPCCGMRASADADRFGSRRNGSMPGWNAMLAEPSCPHNRTRQRLPVEGRRCRSLRKRPSRRRCHRC